MAVAQAKELEWFPCYPDRLLASGKWQAMKDYQRGWYWQLLVLMTRSKPLGYLPFDGRLWALAGACSKQYWDNHSALVLASFKVEEFDGAKWIYSEPLLKVLCEQKFKHDQAVEKGRFGSSIKLKRSSASNKYSFEFNTIWENNTWKKTAKHKAFGAFEKALEVIQQENKKTRDEAIASLADAMEEFKISPAGKEHGLFDGYTPPHPASWLNAQRWTDDRRFWRPGARPGNGRPGNGGGSQAHPAHFAEEKCATCGGSGWDTTTGKAVRCECFNKNRAARAASGAKA